MMTLNGHSVGGNVIPRGGGRPAAGGRLPGRLSEVWRKWGFVDMWNPSVRNTDLVLVLLVTGLLALGLLMIYSSTMSEYNALIGWDLSSYLKSQLKWVAIGLVVMLLFWRIRYTFWRNWSVQIIGVTVVALFILLILGQERFGSVRHILSSGSGQPSEMAKLALIIYLADWLSSKGEKLRDFGFGLAPFAFITGIVAALVVLQPDISTTILLVVIAVSMFFVAGADIRQMTIAALIGGATFVLIVSVFEHARARLETFVSAWRNPLEADVLQIKMFVSSLNAGGFWGVGLGNGSYKNMTAFSHSDGIFAVVGEELGLVGCVLVVGLFLGLAYRGLRIARKAPDSYGLILAFGITAWMVLQAFVHIGVITVTIPATGIPLTFVSYGGSAMLVSLAGAGILLSISCCESKEEGAQGARPGVRGGDGRPRLPGAGGH